MIRLKALIKSILLESDYYQKLSDEDQEELARQYFDIGQDDEDAGDSYCWIWDRYNMVIKAAKGGTHSMNFGHRTKDTTYSGWYDPKKDAISVVFPESESRKLTGRPTVDDIPQQIYQALIRKFKTQKPRFVVFEIRLEPPVDVQKPKLAESEPAAPEEQPGYRGRKTYGKKMSFDDLLQATTPARKEKAQGHVRNRSIPVSVEEGNEAWNFRYRSDRQTGDPGEPYQGRITFLKGEVGSGDSAKDLQCEVDCECKDYMYRFAYNNAESGAGKVGNDTLSGVINRKPKPAYDYGIGLCKHLASLRKYLQTKIASTRKSNLFEAVDEVAKQGPFTISYYD